MSTIFFNIKNFFHKDKLEPTLKKSHLMASAGKCAVQITWEMKFRELMSLPWQQTCSLFWHCMNCWLHMTMTMSFHTHPMHHIEMESVLCVGLQDEA